MFFGEFFIAFIIAFLLAVFFAAILGWERPGRSGVGPALLFLFLLLFLTTWAVGSWVQPFGPTFWGAYWVPFLIVGLIFALFIVALIPPRRSARRPTITQHQQTEKSDQTDAGYALGGFFWLLIVIFIVVIIVHYA